MNDRLPAQLFKLGSNNPVHRLIPLLGLFTWSLPTTVWINQTGGFSFSIIEGQVAKFEV